MLVPATIPAAVRGGGSDCRRHGCGRCCYHGGNARDTGDIPAVDDPFTAGDSGLCVIGEVVKRSTLKRGLLHAIGAGHCAEIRRLLFWSTSIVPS